MRKVLLIAAFMTMPMTLVVADDSLVISMLTDMDAIVVDIGDVTAEEFAELNGDEAMPFYTDLSQLTGYAMADPVILEPDRTSVTGENTHRRLTAVKHAALNRTALKFEVGWRS